MAGRTKLSVCLVLRPCAAPIWLVLASTGPTRPYAAIRHVPPGETKPATQVADDQTFYVTNLSSNPIVLANPFIDLKVGSGWHRDTNWVPDWDSTNLGTFQLGPFQSASISVAKHQAPAPWRLHVYVSTQVHGLSAVPAWLRYFGDRRTWRVYKTYLGWKVWKWPPFGRSSGVILYNRGFELISQEIEPYERIR